MSNLSLFRQMENKGEVGFFSRIVLLITISLTWILTSCGGSFQEETEQLRSYLLQEHSQEIEDALYIIIPVHSCDACRQIVYRNLLTTTRSKDIKIVFSGEVREALTNQYLGRLDIMGVGLIYDQKENAVAYDLVEEEYPMGLISFIDVVDNEVVSKVILRPDMINGEVDIRREVFKNYIE